MPINTGNDRYGAYIRWGNRKKYYFTPGNPKSFNKAYDLALRQMRAIYSRGYFKK